MKMNFTAKLVSFSKIRDIPKSLYPYVKIMEIREKKDLKMDDYVIIFKIIETIDSYHAISIDSSTNLEAIKNKISDDLEAVILTDEKYIIVDLLNKFNRGFSPRFLQHIKFTSGKYKYRH